MHALTRVGAATVVHGDAIAAVVTAFQTGAAGAERHYLRVLVGVEGRWRMHDQNRQVAGEIDGLELLAAGGVGCCRSRQGDLHCLLQLPGCGAG